MPSATTNSPISGRSQWLSSLLVRRRPLSLVTAQLNDSTGAGLISVGSALVLQVPDSRGADRARGAHNAGRDLKPHEGFVERQGRRLVVDVRLRSRQALLGALASRFGALLIDLLRALGELRKDGDAVGQHLGEAKRQRDVDLLLSFAVPQLAHRQRREKWSVPRQH